MKTPKDDSHSPDSWLAKTTAKLKAELISDDSDEKFSKPPLIPSVDSGYVSTTSFSEYCKLKKTPIKPRASLSKNAQGFYDLVEFWTQNDPRETEGRKWSGKSAKELADLMGMSIKQVGRYASQNPFHFVVKKTENKKEKLIRIAPPSDKTPEDFARMMATTWRKHRKEREKPHEFGLLVGMAKDSHPGLAPDIFDTVI